MDTGFYLPSPAVFRKPRRLLTPLYAPFRNTDFFAVGIGRVIPLCRTYIAFVAGAFGQSFLSFLAASFCGIFVWNSVLIGVGYFCRENWSVITQYYQSYRDTLLLIFIVLLLLFLLHRIAKNYFVR